MKKEYILIAVGGDVSNTTVKFVAEYEKQI